MTDVTSTSSKYAHSSADLFGHPKGLYVLCMTEMWERFSYYGMRTLLVYYMIKELLYTQARSSEIYGIYTGLVYFTPLFGGILADKFWGQRKSILFGGLLMALGEFLMVFHATFIPALVCLIIGTGAFSPNLAAQVGNLYKEDDPRLDSAYSIYYLGVNVGAMFSPLICGTLAESFARDGKWMYHYGFLAAGIGMVIGLTVYYFGSKKYLLTSPRVREIDKKAGQAANNKSVNNFKNEEIYLSTGRVKRFIKKIAKGLTKGELAGIIAIITLAFFNILFWGVYEQQGNTLAIWTEQATTNRHLFGAAFPAMPVTWFQSVNPLFIIILTPILVAFWDWQARRGKAMSSVFKMGLGCVLLGASFLFMIKAAGIAQTHGSASAWWFVGCILVLTIGELFLSPIGLSLVMKIAPARMVSMMMGVWFLASFFGNYMSGFLGTYWEKMGQVSFFWMLLVLAFIAGIAIFLLLKPIKWAISIREEELAN